MKFKMGLAILAATALVATSAHAGLVNIGSGGIKVNTNEVVKTVAKKGLEKGINDKLAKKNCHFVATKKDPVGTISCHINGIIGELKNWHDGLTATGVANNFDIHIETSHATDQSISNKRLDIIHKPVKSKISYWDYRIEATTGNGDAVKIWITADL
jgi:hypothetical protein